ncbi:hypothetical protein B0G77_2190 [Paraburkholderia sp. BL10I2N1]|nr:hypothetical protein B0G77_2190 [Paraburkholderia sp. BL10I2N1]
MRARTRRAERTLGGLNRARTCAVLRAVATRNTMRLAAAEGATEAALPPDVQHRESHEPSTEIRLLRRPKRVLN